MKLTVDGILKMKQLENLKIAAGVKGLSRTVESVSVLETTKKTVPIKEGQLLISSFYTVAGNLDEQLNAIHMLNDCKSSGLIIYHIGTTIPRIPKEITDLCNELEFPIITAPAETDCNDIISPILEILLEKKRKDLVHAMEVYDKMTNLILEEKDADTIVDALGKLLNRPVYFFNHNNICVHSSASQLSNKCSSYIKTHIEKNFNAFINEKTDIIVSGFENSESILLSPITSSTMYYGVLAILNAQNMKALDYVSLKQAKNSVAIITINKINLKDYNNVLKFDFINDLVSWNFKDEQTAIKRGVNLDYDISNIRSAMVLDIALTEAANIPEVLQKEKIQSEILCITVKEMALLSQGSIVVSYSGRILVLFSFKKETDGRKLMFKTAEHLRKTISYNLNISISAGIGQCYDNISSIKKCYEESLDALNICNKIYCTPKTVFFEDVEIFSLVTKDMNAERAKKIIKNLLEPVINYDKENNSQLFETFKMLIFNDSDTIAVADKMFLHKNTVLQRRKKILSLYDYDPFALPHRLQFEFAIMLCRLYCE
ncbi:MAG: PurC-like protein [Sedimentibacter sp.]|jgi:sugar diacid utilization regulator|nr:PurC-like protein [Sedimentibacter sp.]